MRSLQWHQEARHKQQRQAYVALHDKLLEERRPELKSAEVQHQAGRDVLEYLGSLGVTTEEAKAAHNTPEFHNVVISQALYDASKLFKAKQMVSRRRANPVSKPMRPGSTMETPGRSAPKMPTSFEGREGRNAAAELIAARRRGR
jgi:hypothetical protein